MKKLLALIAIMAIVMVVSLVNAAPIDCNGWATIGQDDLMTWDVVKQGDHPNFTLNSIYPKGSDSIYVDFSLGNSSDGQIGWDMTPAPGNLPSSYYNLSGYNGIALKISNEGTGTGWDDGGFMANIFINTGWTDDPWNQADQYAQNTWTWINPGKVETLYLDFSNADDGFGNWGQVNNLGYVSALGVNFYVNNGGDYLADVDPIPEPTTMLLMASGLIGLVGYAVVRRKNQK
jgi:hypothetical protein